MFLSTAFLLFHVYLFLSEGIVGRKTSKSRNMKTKIQQSLRKWEGSLRRNGHFDIANYAKISSDVEGYIRKDRKSEVSRLLTACRDATLSPAPNNEQILKDVRHALFLIQAEITTEKRKSGIDVDFGQRQRYEAVTKRLYSEKLKFKGDKCLREADVTLMEGKDARKVRRIVEKRMCQEYHRHHKGQSEYRGSGRTRHEMDRAVSYELYNLGQLDGYTNKRESGTHWKKVIDYSTGEYVMKKKVEYDTLEEALLNIELYRYAHPDDHRPMNAYYCEHCHHYHIGHDRVEDETAA